MANESAALANERAKTLEASTEQLRKDNLKAEENLETEKRKRLILAVSLLPRAFRDQSGAILTLKKFPDIAAVFEYVDQDEPLSTAKQIYFVLTQVPWKLSRRYFDPAFIRPGVSISASIGFKEDPSAAKLSNEEEFAKSRKSMKDWGDSQIAADALTKVLNDSGIEAATGLHYLLDLGQSLSKSVKSRIHSWNKP